MSDALTLEIRELVADVFGLDPEEVTTETSGETLEEWDSLRHLDVVLALEHRYGLSFTPDDIVAMRSVLGIRRVIEAKKSA